MASLNPEWLSATGSETERPLGKRGRGLVYSSCSQPEQTNSIQGFWPLLGIGCVNFIVLGKLFRCSIRLGLSRMLMKTRQIHTKNKGFSFASWAQTPRDLQLEPPSRQRLQFHERVLLHGSCKYTNIQIYKYTNTQIHKYTNTQIYTYKYRNTA